MNFAVEAETSPALSLHPLGFFSIFALSKYPDEFLSSTLPAQA